MEYINYDYPESDPEYDSFLEETPVHYEKESSSSNKSNQNTDQASNCQTQNNHLIIPL